MWLHFLCLPDPVRGNIGCSLSYLPNPKATCLLILISILGPVTHTHRTTLAIMHNWIISGLIALICWGAQWKNFPIISAEPSSSGSGISCDLIVDAGPDTNVCAPGGSVTLMGSITGDELFFLWSPSTGLSNPFSLTPIATITGPITYTLTAWGVDPSNPELIVNGDFSAGNTGFNSDYTYVVDVPGIQNEMVPEGTYAIIPNPNLVHTGFSACNDHTGGGGNMMVVNGAANLQDIWCQTITVSPNGWYNVAAWVASVNPSSPAQLQFSINGMPIGPIINALPTPCTWIPFNAVWNSGSSSTAEICILNLNTAPGGNDFALDDISMVALCAVEDEVEITLLYEDAPEPSIDGPAFLCEGETGIYTASFPPDPQIYSYQWSVPSGAVLLNGQGTPQVSILWEDAQIGELCLAIETRCDMNEGCFEVEVATLPDFPLIAGPTSLCPGETATFYTAEQDPDDFYNWIIPVELNIIGGEGTNEIEVEWALPGEAEICLEVTNACGTTDNCTILTLYPDYLTLFDTIICAGTTIDINGTTYGNGLLSGLETFTSTGGCDSLVEIEITEATALEFMFITNLCPGDSVYLEGAYQTGEGVYVDSFLTISGCDSLVITEIIISPFDTTWILLASCNPIDTGTTIQTINQGNCDSTIITTVTLSPTDTTLLAFFSCSPADTGLVTQLFSNQYGCDSLIMTTTYLLRTDTTNLFQSTCDPSGVGITQQLFTNLEGCDSLVITTVAFLESDTTSITLQSCFIADTGTTSALLINSKGCDSLVIVHTVYTGSDTTFIFTNSCFPADSGISVTHLINQSGCDSIVEMYTTLLRSDTTYLFSSSCLPQDTGVLSQHLTNSDGCDSLVILSTSLDPINLCAIQGSISVAQPLCFGEPGEVTVSALIGLEPFTVDWHHTTLAIDGTAQILTSPGDLIFALSTPGIYSIDITSANGLTESHTILIEDIPELLVTATTPTDAFGFNLPCAGDASGIAIATLNSPGTPPYTYSWSTGLNTMQISQLTAGIYTVTVTDNNGCISISSVALAEPPPMLYTLMVNDIQCYGQQNGTVAISGTQGGVFPWLSSLDGNTFQPGLFYSGLTAGAHDLVIRDQQGCILQTQFNVAEPENWSVALGPDTIIAFGQSYTLDAVILGQPEGATHISWSDDQCEDCLTRIVEPEIPSTYEVTAGDENGCIHTDEIHIDVFIDRNIYVPNIFSPNGDQINDYFMVSSASGIKEIEAMTIYDRWGSLVFQAFHFLPDDPAFSWDGRMRGQPMNPGVYVYVLKAIALDDRIITRYGDVTLVR